MMNMKASIPMIDIVHTFLMNYPSPKTSDRLQVLEARLPHHQPTGAGTTVLMLAQHLL
jgi:hypothetical protein